MKRNVARDMLRLLRPSGGAVRIGGHNPRTDERARRAIGFVAHQSLFYDDLTPRENLDFVARLYGVAERAAAVGRMLDRLVIGRERDVQLRRLSRGMVQGVALARAAIIPAAGWGTRLLPASKAIPKEMLPVVDRPGIQYIVEEAVASRLKEIILVTGKGKGCIEDHFDIQGELEDILERKGKKELLTAVREISRMVSIIAVRQKQQLGTGDAVLCAAPVAEGEAVAVLYPDDMIDAEVPVTRQLLDVYERHQTAAVIALREVPEEDTHLYGIVEGERIEDRLYLIKRIVEKPPRGKAPSNLAITGRYILSPCFGSEDSC